VAQQDADDWHMVDEIDLVAMVVDHAALARLCADLEAVADRLPVPPDPTDAARLREGLLQLLPAHEAREHALGRQLFGKASKTPPAAAILCHIERQRAACVVQGQDVATALADAARHAPETLGYMLRCFFDACRQAMAFEELAILHLSSRRLTRDARALLLRSLVRRCAD